MQAPLEKKVHRSLVCMITVAILDIQAQEN